MLNFCTKENNLSNVLFLIRFVINNPFMNLQGTPAYVACILLTGSTLMWTGILVSVERYYAVLYPLRHQTGLIATKLKSIITAFWIYAFLRNITS